MHCYSKEDHESISKEQIQLLQITVWNIKGDEEFEYNDPRGRDDGDRGSSSNGMDEAKGKGKGTDDAKRKGKDDAKKKSTDDEKDNLKRSAAITRTWCSDILGRLEGIETSVDEIRRMLLERRSHSPPRLEPRSRSPMRGARRDRTPVRSEPRIRSRERGGVSVWSRPAPSGTRRSP